MIFMFTMENTEGFDQKTLDKMNAEVKKRMSKHDPKSKDYKKLYEQVTGLRQILFRGIQTLS